MLKYLFVFCTLFSLSTMLTAQSEKSIKIDESVDKAIDDIQEKLDSLDLSDFFEKELPKRLEEITPNEAQIEQIEDAVKQGLAAIKDIDLSQFEDIFEELEKELEGIFKNMPTERRKDDTEKKTKKI